MPDGSFLFFFGTEQAAVPFGNGVLCVSGDTTRILPPGVVLGGVAERAVDLPAVGIALPGTLHFQCWFRDPAGGGASFDTSDGLSISFTP